jgi:hypothetical protein
MHGPEITRFLMLAQQRLFATAIEFERQTAHSAASIMIHSAITA